MDMATIHQRVVASKYQTLEDMVADFVLMFDNACKYNEPDSLIYKVRNIIISRYSLFETMCKHSIDWPKGIFRFKYDFDGSISQPKFDPIGVWTHNFLITGSAFHVPEMLAITVMRYTYMCPRISTIFRSCVNVGLNIVYFQRSLFPMLS